jgi:hypothetical protein
MLHSYPQYQIQALKQLVEYKNIFYRAQTKENFATPEEDRQPLQKSIEAFIEIFCQHDFADADYRILQGEPTMFADRDLWFHEVNIDTICKFLTYIIWTDRTINNYFLTKIQDGTIEKLLTRLEAIVSSDSRHSQGSVNIPETRNNIHGQMF